MNTPNVGLSRFMAAVSATVITVLGACAFMSSSGPIERDPFRFASSVTANAAAHVALWHRRTASTCPNNPEAWDPLAPVCVRV
jgi:hypothetical protein